MLISLFVYILWGAWVQRVADANQGTCGRHVRFTTEKDGLALQGHVIKNLTLDLGTPDPCRGQCIMESHCLSINVGQPINDRIVCELSDSDDTLHPEDLKPRATFTYTGTENACSSNPCAHNAICLNGFTDKRYHCICKAGENCEIAAPASSCHELYTKHKSSKVFTLIFGSQKIPVYCHMGNFGCGDGGWTLAMKIDGNKRTFHYDSHFWSDRNAYNLAGGKTGFDLQETKLPTYWNTPFSKICLGMKIGHQKKFIVINKHANSLYSLIADGRYRATSLGRNTWKTLIGLQASLQANCNKEGFNSMVRSSDSKARIGIIGNQQNHCGSCDSRIGFGTGGLYDDSNTCGNEATRSPDNGDKHIKAMGYILVQ